MTVVDSFKSKTVAVFLVMAALGSCASENENISTDSNLAQALTEKQETSPCTPPQQRAQYSHQQQE